MKLLTKRQRYVLTLMATPSFEDDELVYERGRGYIGVESVSSRTVFALLRLRAISLTGGEVRSFKRYRINETGRALLGPLRLVL